MQFSRIVSFFAFFMGLSFFVLGNPIAFNEKRDTDAIGNAQDVVNTLQTQANSIISQIQAAPKTNAAITPLINDLINSVNTAQSSVGRIRARATDVEKRQLGEAVAVTLAAIIKDIVACLNGVDIVFLGLGGLITALDIALDSLIRGLDVVVIGLGGLLGGLLAGVGGLLASLGFGLLGGLLGIL